MLKFLLIWVATLIAISAQSAMTLASDSDSAPTNIIYDDQALVKLCPIANRSSCHDQLIVQGSSFERFNVVALNSRNHRRLQEQLNHAIEAFRSEGHSATRPFAVSGFVSRSGFQILAIDAIYSPN